MPDSTQSEVQPHDAAEELLPWYATGQLDVEERALVDRHLSSCAHCRRQLAFERRMIDQFAALTPEIDTGWARLKQRLEPAQQPAPREGLWGKVARDAAELWQTLSRPAVAALAAVQVAIIAIAGLAVSLSQESYQALGSAPPPQAANVVAMFRADTTESQMRSLLQSNGASLVGGPTPADAYLLQVPSASRSAVVARLRADGHVTMAEPIDGAQS